MQTAIAIAAVVSLLIASVYLRRDMSARGALTFKASTTMFIFAGIALLGVWYKPAQWQIGNFIVLAIIAAVIVMAIAARRQER